MLKDEKEKLEKWCSENLLDIQFVTDNVFQIGDSSFYLIEERRQGLGVEESVFTEELHLNVTDEEVKMCKDVGIENWCFRFGNRFMYTPIDTVSNPEFTMLKYIGKAKLELDMEYAFLGVRGGYEICNGTGKYSEWGQKAKFLGISSLGICEKNTLAGSLPFQEEIRDVKTVIGETVWVKREDTKRYYVKCYAINEEGWFNLLLINKYLNVDNQVENVIPEPELLKYGKGLVCVLGTEFSFKNSNYREFKKSFDSVYYQVNMTEFITQEKEKERLLYIKEYFDKYMTEVEPVLIQDAFYLDEEYSHIHTKLNGIGRRSDTYASVDRWFKTLDEIFSQWSQLFRDDDERLFDIFTKSVENTVVISNMCSYKIETGNRHLPVFEWEGDESNEDLFFRLIYEGLERHGLLENREYWDRVEEEIRVIKKGEVIDYFLILWDIVEWCKKNGILTGVGRGSAGGSLVAYLLGLTGIDPIEYGLLFERFLNEGRVQTSLPDIDTDIEALRREDVKNYMREKYGYNNVCSVGTYGGFKLRSALKDLAKQYGMDHKTLNYITKPIEMDVETDADFREFFRQSLGNQQLKEFVVSNTEIIESIPIILGQPRNQSVHPCAMLILPSTDQYGRERDIFSWLPVRLVGGELVSEWEGNYVEDAGFLKEDILGISQLDKFRAVFDKVKKNRGIDLDLHSVDIEDKRMYDLFSRGLTSDVFHFGSEKLTVYEQQVMPKNIREMIAILSVYRPGPIESGAHLQYVKLKHGLIEPEYDYMLEEVTKETYGLYIYQEQVMKAVQVLGGMDLVTADYVRKAMGKMKLDLIKEYRDIFLKGAIERGCDRNDAIVIWNKLEAFARYGFNKSHSTAYTYTALVGQWLKVNFPIEFWSTALEYSRDFEIPRFVAELEELNYGVSVVPPDINKSQDHFITDVETGKIYWSIGKIKYVGESGTEEILRARNEEGEFFSMEEFVNRVEKRKVNKRAVEHLVLTGCFDEMYNIQSDTVYLRRAILDDYYTITKKKPDERMDLPEISKMNWWWIYMQKDISGLGYFNFEEIIMLSGVRHLISIYMKPEKIQFESSVKKKVSVAGVIKDVRVRSIRNRGEMCSIVLECNQEQVHFTIWPETWVKYKDMVINRECDMFIGSGTVEVDNYKKLNVIQTQKDSEVFIF